MLGKLKVVEYVGKLLPDGHLSIPEEIRKELDVNLSLKIAITLVYPHVSDEQKGWEAFRNLGRAAIGGKLSNASEKHDQYLYGKER